MSTQLYQKPSEADLLAAVRAHFGKDATVAAIAEANGWDIQDVGGPLFKMVRDGKLVRNRERQTLSIPDESLPRLPLVARPPLKLAEAPASQQPGQLPEEPAPAPAPPTQPQPDPLADFAQQLRQVVAEEQRREPKEPKQSKQPHARPDIPAAPELHRQMVELREDGIRNPIIALAREYSCDVKTIRRRLDKIKPQAVQPVGRPSRNIDWPPDPEFLHLLDTVPKQHLATRLGCTVWAIDYHRQVVEKRAGEPNVPGETPPEAEGGIPETTAARGASVVTPTPPLTDLPATVKAGQTCLLLTTQGPVELVRYGSTEINGQTVWLMVPKAGITLAPVPEGR